MIEKTLSSDKKLPLFIRYLPLVLMAIFITVVIAILINQNHYSLTKDIGSLRENFYSSERKSIQNRVINVAEQIESEKQRTETLLQEDVKQRVNEALSIANNLYKTHQGESPERLKQILLEALRPIRFNQGRGYYFIYDLDGTNIMHPILTHIEGKNLWDLQDVRGSYVIRDLANLAKNSQQAYHRWWWSKPEILNSEFDKIGYVAHFEPFNWFIGTGEYVVDVEQDIQRRLIARISDYQYEDDGYIFIMNSKGALLSHPNSSLIGVERLDAVDKTGKKYVKELIDTAKNGGGFVRYHSLYTPTGSSDSSKLSFVIYLPDWDWVIGTGVYLRPVEDFLSDREAQITERNQRELEQVILASVFGALALGIISLMIGNAVGKRFRRLKTQISSDFRQLESAKDQLQYQALHDSLTSLPNRAYLIDFIRQAISSSSQDNTLTAVMFVDLDDFKKVNDAFGHSIGDKLLTQVGQRFDALLRSNQLVSRFGGDEFVFCFPNLGSVSDAERIAASIREIFQSEIEVEGKVISSSCSIGVSLYPQDGLNPEDLIAKADTALYTSKARRKGKVLFFDESINKRVQYELTLEKQLRCAIKNDELYMVYQPQIELCSGKIESVEALLRWHNPELGHVSPVELIRKAEEIGLIHEIGQFVIRTACQTIVKACPNGDNALGLSINISPSQLIAKDFLSVLNTIIDEEKIDRQRITIEITENVLIDDLEIVTPILTQLREHGFAISLDDFGTGFSSLSYLCNLPINEIKIDRSFVDKMLINEQSDALIRAIIAIGKAHSMKVVAEGIETNEQNQHLLAHDCHLGQGYFYAKPLLIDDLMDFKQSNITTSCINK
ncbi:bifunctional diguanylate cyclase/phosphodiesterase [Vibrio aquaticus]|uniref:bifunctional diguanylate cyclase/phosphodiesterase n=1 Tax=Vibrio aquaticus TaxID=2496559 RepID=UPI001FC974A7|nr:cache domain-containing protein [Vibrio aquaticus]